VQIVRTIIWVMVLFGILTFSFFNWKVLETKVPVLVITAFVLGLLPMWLYHRSTKWSLGRRIRSLEASIKSSALAQRPAPSDAGSTNGSAMDKPVESPASSGDSLKPVSEGNPA